LSVTQDEDAIINTYKAELKDTRYNRRALLKTPKYHDLSEEQVYMILYLRYGCFDTKADPIRSLKDVADIIGSKVSTCHTALLRFECRGNKYVNLKLFSLGNPILKNTDL